jgi:uncharacterized protein (TIGR03067 family)
MRCILVLITVLSLAFAPTPFPKTTANHISLRNFQGTWKVISMEAVDEGGKKKPTPWNVTRIRVKGDQFTYLAGDMQIGRDRFTIDANKKPALIDLYSPDWKEGKPYRVGLIKRDRGQVVLLFYQTGPESRAKSFSNPPPFWWWVVLEREQ